jgi:hypothetical protein
MMRSRNPQVQEDGFHHLLPHAAEFVDQLTAEFHAERKDQGLRAWLLELIAAARDERALPLLAELLNSPDDRLRPHAEQGLRLLNTPESRRILFEASPSRRAPR